MKAFAVVAVLALSAMSTTSAMPDYLKNFPNGEAVGNKALGHKGDAYTEFTKLWRENGKDWKKICDKPFPGANMKVGEAFGDPCCKWSGNGATDKVPKKFGDDGIPTEKTTCDAGPSPGPSSAAPGPSSGAPSPSSAAPGPKPGPSSAAPGPKPGPSSAAPGPKPGPSSSAPKPSDSPDQRPVTPKPNIRPGCKVKK